MDLDSRVNERMISLGDAARIERKEIPFREMIVCDVCCRCLAQVVPCEHVVARAELVSAQSSRLDPRLHIIFRPSRSFGSIIYGCLPS
jgi:hypothetical protein